jgi:hypothetical protein
VFWGGQSENLTFTGSDGVARALVTKIKVFLEKIFSLKLTQEVITK